MTVRKLSHARFFSYAPRLSNQDYICVIHTGTIEVFKMNIAVDVIGNYLWVLIVTYKIEEVNVTVDTLLLTFV